MASLLEFNKLLSQAYMLVRYGSDEPVAIAFLRHELAGSDELHAQAEEYRTRFDDPELRGSAFQNVIHRMLVRVLDHPEGDQPPAAALPEEAQAP